MGTKLKYFRGPSVCLEDGDVQDNWQGSQSCLGSGSTGNLGMPNWGRKFGDFPFMSQYQKL